MCEDRDLTLEKSSVIFIEKKEGVVTKSEVPSEEGKS